MSTVRITWNLSLNIGSITFIKPEVAFNMVKTASGFRLDFPASISMPYRNPEERFLVEDMKVTLTALGDGREIAIARCPVSMSTGDPDRGISFSWDATFATMAVYERIRENREPQFAINVQASVRYLLQSTVPRFQIANSPAETFCGHTTIKYSRDAWVATLRQIGFRDSVIVEIPYPSEPPHEWESVWNALADARNAFDKGGTTAYIDAARSVRHALEKWQDIEKEEMGPGWTPPKRDEREARTVNQRIDNIRWHLMQLAHESAHTGSEKWSRDEALLLLNTLAALIAVRKP